MDGVKVALRAWTTAHKLLFWALVEQVLRWWVELLHIVHWYREVAREVLVLDPSTPKDLYDNGYALFAYDLGADAWIGHWRAPSAKPGEPAAETYAWREQWDGIPWHPVEGFKAMPQISFKCRAVPVAWCREHLKVGDGAAMLAAVREKVKVAANDMEARQEASVLEAQAEADTVTTKH